MIKYLFNPFVTLLVYLYYICYKDKNTMNLLNIKKQEVATRDEVLTFSNGCRLNVSLYGRVLAAKLSAGEGLYLGSEHYYEVFKNNKYRTALEKEIKNVLKENKSKN